MSKEKLTNYKSLEEVSRYKGRPNSIEDNNVNYNNCNIYAMRQKIADLEAKLAEKDKEIEIHNNTIKKLIKNCGNANCEIKISFCIEQLEKVKETTECVLDNALKNSSLNQSYYDRLLDEIDNQIKQLKEMK